MTKKRWIILSIVVVLLIVGLIFAFSGGNTDAFYTVKKETLEEQVQSSGKTKPAQEVNLGFVSSGKIAKSYATIGKPVEIGEVLMQLEAADLYANLNKAKADLASESAISASDSIDVSEAIENMRQVLLESALTLENTIQNDIDQMFELPRTTLARFRPRIVVGSQTELLSIRPSDRERISDDRIEIENVLRDLAKVKPLIAQSTTPQQYVDAIKEKINFIQYFVDQVAFAVNRAYVDDDTYLEGLGLLKDDIAEARFDIQALGGQVLSANEEINLALSQDVPGTDGQLTERDARILKARAEVQAIEAEIAKTIIRSPIQGIVTKVELDPGEIVGAGNTILSVISDNDFEIEANISEVNISKVNVDDIVRITFDGISGREFWGRIIYVEPAETIVDDVVTFKVKVALDNTDFEIKSGLTANLTISTNTKENVVAIPAYAVSKREGKSFVQKIVGEEKVETEVTTGIMGSNGLLEILSGLNENDVIAITAN